MDETYAQSAGLKLGDTITLHEDDESKDIADTLVTDTFTVVGSGSYAWYLNFDRGTADIGNGDVRFFLMVPPESFALEAYTVIYATTDGADGMICYDQDYKDYVSGIEDRIELLEDARCRARYDEVQQEGADKIADARQQIADGEKELQDAKDKLADAKVQLDDAAQTIADGEKEIADGKKELADAKREIRKRQKEIDDGWAELNEAKEQLADAADQIRSAGSQLSSGQAQLSAGRAELNDQKQQFAQLEQQAGQLKDPAAYQAAKGNYEQLKAAEQAGSPLTEEQQAALGFYGQVLPGVDAALGGETNPSGEQLSQAVESALQPTRDALSAADQKLNASESELASGRRQLESAQEEYDAGAAEIAENEQKLIDGQQQIDDAQKEIRKNERKLKDAEEELADGRKEYEDAKQEFDDAQAEFDEKSVSAQADIDEAKQKVADAEEELADLSVPEWYVLDRESIQSYVEYGMDTDRIGAIGQVFPAIFFLVAALVSLTTMTRMVEEERRANRHDEGAGLYAERDRSQIHRLCALGLGAGRRAGHPARQPRAALYHPVGLQHPLCQHVRAGHAHPVGAFGGSDGDCGAVHGAGDLCGVLCGISRRARGSDASGGARAGQARAAGARDLPVEADELFAEGNLPQPVPL